VNEIPLDELHQLIDTIEEGIARIDERNRKGAIPISELPELSIVLIELFSGGTTYVGHDLGINSSLLGKFIKGRGTIQKHVARKIADRLRSYLRSQDQVLQQADKKEEPTPPSPPKREDIKTVTIAGDTWIGVKSSSEVKLKIGVISMLLDSIIEQTTRANEPEDQQLLTAIERQQLVAILETALNVLKSPMVEKGLLKKAREVLRKGAESTAEKGVQQGLGKLMEAAGQRIAELIGLLF